MNKPMEFNSLFELIKNFDEAYKDCGHKLVKVDQKLSFVFSSKISTDL